MLLPVGIVGELLFCSTISQLHVLPLLSLHVYGVTGSSWESGPKFCLWMHSHTTGASSLSHLILYMCFPHQFFIKGDANAFNLLRQGHLHSSILESYGFIGLPLSYKAGDTLFAFCILRVFSWNTPWNIKHPLCTFHISCEFRVLLISQKNKPRNPLIFRVNADTAAKYCKVRKQERKMRRKVMQTTQLYTSRFLHFALIFAYFAISYGRPKGNNLCFLRVRRELFNP